MDIRKYFFSFRIVHVWNSLPAALFYIATKGNLTATLKIGDTNKLLAPFPLQATHFGGWFVDFPFPLIESLCQILHATSNGASIDDMEMISAIWANRNTLKILSI